MNKDCGLLSSNKVELPVPIKWYAWSALMHWLSESELEYGYWRINRMSNEVVVEVCRETLFTF